MENKFKYSNSNKRYHTLDYFYKTKFNSKVFKVSLNAGFSCPNLDGTLSNKGCIYCSNSGSGEFAGNVNDDLVTQFNTVKDMISHKWPNSKYIAYFQAHTNTYAPVTTLKEKYESVLKLNNVIGLSIATRPDAISDDCLDYLEELNKRTFLTVELGLQSSFDNTLKWINRGHDIESFKKCVKRLKDLNINVVVHIIDGLPIETEKMMLENIRFLNHLNIDGIKIHNLYIIKNTPLGEMYKEKKFSLFSRDEYIDIVCKQLMILNPDIVVHRLTGDPKKEDLIAPLWALKKIDILNGVVKKLKKEGTYQGIYYEKN